MRKELSGFTLIYILTKPSKRYILRKGRKFHANNDDDSGNFNVDHLVKSRGEVAACRCRRKQNSILRYKNIFVFG